MGSSLRNMSYQGVVRMDREYLAKLCDARDTLCGACKSGGCLQCRVRHIIDDAFGELSEEDEDA